jgi:decaprenylphospho-beta-D-erythro-pentofuranosid-2-ulose 2-reductase
VNRVLILGATSSIARALATCFARDGAALYLAARDAGEAARIAADLTVRTGARVCAGAFDATDYERHPELLSRAASELGGLNGVALCFGVLGDHSIAARDAACARRIIAENFTAAASFLTEAANYMAAQRSGFIIVLGSVAGERGRASNYVYGSAKGALALFAQGLRARLLRSGVHILTVKLGVVDTRMTYGRTRSMLAVSPTTAAHGIYAAWCRQADVAYVPRFWRPIMAAVRATPERLFKYARF